jgi:L-serine dehydratase
MSYSHMSDLVADSAASGSLGEAVISLESEETGASRETILSRFMDALDVMEAAVAAGLRGEARSRSGLVGGDARRVAETSDALAGATLSRAVAAALAVAEVNASMGRVVAAPTGGASGALAAAGGVGGVIAAKASLSGASAGCQAEIGAGAAMAATAAVELAGGTPVQAGHAASLALQGLLGLVCDPVGGLVEVPCVARNATAAGVALAAAQMALAGVEFPIPFDEVASAMGSVGRSLPPSLRETALGGLAATPTGKRLGSTH